MTSVDKCLWQGKCDDVFLRLGVDKPPQDIFLVCESGLFRSTKEDIEDYTLERGFG